MRLSGPSLVSSESRVAVVVFLYFGAIYLSTVYVAAHCYQLDVLYNIRDFLSNFWKKMLQTGGTSIYTGEKDHSVASLANSSEQGLHCDSEVTVHGIEL